jgi:hypothetical protein
MQAGVGPGISSKQLPRIRGVPMLGAASAHTAMRPRPCPWERRANGGDVIRQPASEILTVCLGSGIQEKHAPKHRVDGFAAYRVENECRENIHIREFISSHCNENR